MSDRLAEFIISLLGFLTIICGSVFGAWALLITLNW